MFAIAMIIVRGMGELFVVGFSTTTNIRSNSVVSLSSSNSLQMKTKYLSSSSTPCRAVSMPTIDVEYNDISQENDVVPKSNTSRGKLSSSSILFVQVSVTCSPFFFFFFFKGILLW